MYQGVIKEKPTHCNDKEAYRFKMQMLQKEQVEINGAIGEKLVIKTVEFKTDRNIRVRDFDILNLQSIGALNQLQPVQLNKSIDQVTREAETANNVMDKLELIKEIENYGNENQVSTEAA